MIFSPDTTASDAGVSVWARCHFDASLSPGTRTEKRRQKVKDESFEEVNEIALAIPPMWEGLTSRKRKARIEELVKANEMRTVNKVNQKMAG
jgi:hypothetical protein